MAGGIFTDRPFEPNTKCIIFSVMVLVFYWLVADQPNPYLVPIIFVVSYVLMAWYDYFYNCDSKMYTGSWGTTGIADALFKPQRRGPEDPSKVIPEREARLVPNQEQAYLKKVYQFHFFMVMPLVIYIGYRGVRGQTTNPQIYGALLGLGFMGLIYHGIRMFVPRDSS